jgi:Cu/Ag efflux pump CusA
VVLGGLASSTLLALLALLALLVLYGVFSRAAYYSKDKEN